MGQILKNQRKKQIWAIDGYLLFSSELLLKTGQIDIPSLWQRSALEKFLKMIVTVSFLEHD